MEILSPTTIGSCLMDTPKLLTVKQYNEIYSKSLEDREDALGRKMSARAKIEQHNSHKDMLLLIEAYPSLAY